MESLEIKSLEDDSSKLNTYWDDGNLMKTTTLLSDTNNLERAEQN